MSDIVVYRDFEHIGPGHCKQGYQNGSECDTIESGLVPMGVFHESFKKTQVESGSFSVAHSFLPVVSTSGVPGLFGTVTGKKDVRITSGLFFLYIRIFNPG